MPPLDSTLTAWRTARLEFLAAKSAADLLLAAQTLPSPDRIAEWERYRQIKSALGPTEKLSIEEVRWVLTLLSADRADAVRSSRANTKAAREASAPTPKATLASILAALGN